MGEKIEEVENIAFVDDELVTDILDMVNHNNNKYILFRLLSSIIRNIISALKLSVKMYLGKLNRIRNDIASTDAFFVVCYCLLYYTCNCCLLLLWGTLRLSTNRLQIALQDHGMD